ncbi:MAG: hypothetical protein QNJ73_01090, partial [Gammaproteobacteria bacterium]|nr:hypothetical protein [Gammaproteobacteria bacterium]
MEFYCNHNTAKTGDTFLRVETYDSDKLSRVVLEEYAVRDQMRGCVIMALPKPDNNVPIFFFQLGGKGDRSIGVLDIASLTDNIDYSPLMPVHEKYSRLLGLGPTKVDWLTKCCSPYLLSCQYDRLDCDLYIEAMEAYFDVWVEHYLKPGVTIDDPGEIDRTRNALYKFKYVLHHYDPAYGIFAKSWGKPVADAFVYLECHDDPGYRPPRDLQNKLKMWDNRELGVIWSEDAQRLAMAAPEASQPDLRRRLEQQAADARLGIITPDIYHRFEGNEETAVRTR